MFIQNRKLMTTCFASTILIGSMLFHVNASHAQSNECPIPFPTQYDADDFRACMNAFSETKSELKDAINVIAALNVRLTRLEEQTFPKADIPIGAIMAFNLRGGCPADWQPYKRAYGRTIVGAIYSGNREEPELKHKIEDTAKYHFDERHGEERVTLIEGQIPEHVHGMGLVNFDNIDIRSVGTQSGGIDMPWYLDGSSGLKEGYEERPGLLMKSVGKNNAHNNMSPYVALYYCEKVAPSE